MEKLERNDGMGTLPVGKLLVSTAVPMMISMLVQALYNIVDSLYVSRVSEEALNAVSLAFPLQTLMIGAGVGTAVGTNALLSRFLGANMAEDANRSANTGVFLSIVTSLLFAAIGLAFSHLYFSSITGNSVIVSYGTSYCIICLAFSMGFFMQATFERMLTATGHSKAAMLCQVAGAVTNIIFDPIFIFGWLGLPRLEVAGAAIATVLGQFVAGIMAIVIVKKKVKEISVTPRRLKWHGPTALAIYKIGFPSIVMQCVSSVMNYGMNLILISFAETATAFFGVYYKLQSFVFMPVFGLNNGMVPIISYNYGAKKSDRVWKTVKLALAIAISIMSLGTILFETMPGTLLSIFNASEDMLSIGTRGLRTIGIHFPIAGFCIIIGSVLQAVGNPVHSVITSAGRQLLVLLPVSWLLGRLGGLDAVWFAFPIAELVSLMLSALFLRKTVKSVNEKLNG